MMKLTTTGPSPIPTLLLIAGFFQFAAGACAAERSPAEQRLAEAAANGKYTFILFHREDDPATQAMRKTVEAALERQAGQASWIPVKVTDPAEKELVRRFDAGRSPMPMVMALAPNGAVTGVYPLKVEPQDVGNAILTPQYAEMVKALQSQKIALVCLVPAEGTLVPKGVADFEKDPHFKGRTHRVVARADDPAEAKFFERMQVKRDLTNPVVVFFAPPGAYLGTYGAGVTREQLSKTIHDAGRCGPNCNHHHH